MQKHMEICGLVLVSSCAILLLVTNIPNLMIIASMIAMPVLKAKGRASLQLYFVSYRTSSVSIMTLLSFKTSPAIMQKSQIWEPVAVRYISWTAWWLPTYYTDCTKEHDHDGGDRISRLVSNSSWGHEPTELQVEHSKKNTVASIRLTVYTSQDTYGLQPTFSHYDVDQSVCQLGISRHISRRIAESMHSGRSHPILSYICTNEKKTRTFLLKK